MNSFFCWRFLTLLQLTRKCCAQVFFYFPYRFLMSRRVIWSNISSYSKAYRTVRFGLIHKYHQSQVIGNLQELSCVTFSVNAKLVIGICFIVQSLYIAVCFSLHLLLLLFSIRLKPQKVVCSPFTSAGLCSIFILFTYFDHKELSYILCSYTW